MAQRGGQPGNKNAAKERLFYNALKRAVKQDNGERLREAAEALLSEAAKGEAWAVRELADRLDGKSVQQVDLTADVVNRGADDLTDEQLARIAAGGSLDAPEAPEGSPEPAALH